MRNRTLIGGLAALAALALACGSSPEVSEAGGQADAAVAKPKAPTGVKMGQKLSVDSSGLKATYTLSKPEIRNRDQYGITPRNGAWLLVFFRVDVTKGEAYTCGCDLSLVEKGGKVHEIDMGGLQNRPDFSVTQLKAGQNADGWVVFDLPEKAINGSKVQLRITSLFADSSYGYWTVKV